MRRCKGILLIGLIAPLLAVQFGCTDLMLRKYRNDELVRNYRYALGENYITVDGIRLCYQDLDRSGKVSDPEDPVLVLPGLGTSIDFWQSTVAAIAAQERVVALDVPGFGKSDKPDAAYDMTWLSERVLAFLDARGFKHVTIIGGSMGGHLALLLALNHPERVDKLVLVGSVGGWEQPGPILAGGLNLFWSDQLVTDHMRRNWPHICTMLSHHPSDAAKAMFRYQLAERARGEQYWPEGRASSRTLKSIFFSSCRDRLSQVRQPTLLVWGRDDEIHNSSNGRDFRERIPDSRLVIVPDSGHLVMVDQPQKFNRLVLDFLRGGTAAIVDGVMVESPRALVARSP